MALAPGAHHPLQPVRREKLKGLEEADCCLIRWPLRRGRGGVGGRRQEAPSGLKGGGSTHYPTPDSHSAAQPRTPTLFTPRRIHRVSLQGGPSPGQWAHLCGRGLMGGALAHTHPRQGTGKEEPGLGGSGVSRNKRPPWLPCCLGGEESACQCRRNGFRP